MRNRQSASPAIQVDMVPLIDIITLLLMFLVIVGGIECSSYIVKLNLPRADQGKRDRDFLPQSLEGRITISLQSINGVYHTIVGGKSFSLGSRHSGNQPSLSAHLLRSAEYMHSRGMCTQRDDGTYSIPVKLRIGEDVPMTAVEDVVSSVAQARMRDVQYAANPNPPSE